MENNILAHLSAAYENFCNTNSLNHVSADEQPTEHLTPAQRKWITAFIELWDVEINQ